VLTADLVHVRRRGDSLSVVTLSDDERARALELAAAYLDVARAHLGGTRGDVEEALGQLDVEPREQRLARGLRKLVLDRCEFEEGTTVDPVELRRTLFSRAANARKAADHHHAFSRGTLLAELANERQATPADLERALYADLPDAHVLRAADLPAPEGLLAVYELAQHQAVLLRAVSVRAKLWNATPAATRALFHKLKFLRLLYRIERLPKNAGFVLHIDGPYSLFDSVTKYGLQLALALPALMACDAWSINADLRWGHERRPLRYRLRGERRAPDAAPESHLPDEVAALLKDLTALDSPWRPSVSDAIFDLPGVGTCVPDLELVHRDTGQTVYLEVLGFWSRDAVWRRIELAQKGLPQPIVFAVSKHLRVSEAALDGELPAALYVYARVMNARAVLERAQAVAERTTS
jgi:predicted nuclease of restriction endonuclease-like RecB superfamily